MSKTRVTLNIDKELNDRWNEVSKNLKMSKSSMLADFLVKVLPVLEQEEPRDIMAVAFKEFGKVMQETGSLFENLDDN